MVFMGFLNQLTTGGLHPVVQFDIPSWISGQRHNSTTVTFSERENHPGTVPHAAKVKLCCLPFWKMVSILGGLTGGYMEVS